MDTLIAQTHSHDHIIQQTKRQQINGKFNSNQRIRWNNSMAGKQQEQKMIRPKSTAQNQRKAKNGDKNNNNKKGNKKANPTYKEE